MATAITLNQYRNPSGIYGGWYPLIAQYKFNAGATYAQLINGFAWQGSKPIGAPAGETEQGGLFTFNGNPDPRNQPVVEERYSFSEMNEFWLKKRFFVPSNYYHRKCSVLDVTGDKSSWQRGDNLLANNGVDTAKVEYISGTTVMALFPTNSFDAQWDGVVTNTTRSQTYPCNRTENWPDNNKFHALWCDGYSFHGASPTIVFELHATGNGGSTIYYHFGADFNVVGTLPNSTSIDVEFIRSSDFGKWFDWIVHVKMATSETAEDGVIEHWLKREGESSYTKLHEQTNAKIGARAAATPANCKFKAGYCHGAANTGFYDTTTLCDSEIILSAQAIDGVE